MIEKKKQVAEVNVENQRNGERWDLEAVLPQGEAEGFFLLRCMGMPNVAGPIMVKELSLLLANGSTFRLTVLREGKSQNPRKVMSELPRRRTSAGYEVQIPDGTWLRTNRFADWFKDNSGVFVQENRNAVTPGGNLDGKHKGVS
jgi:hypothetical protein